MRSLALFPLTLLLAGCSTPSPGERDYPWDPRNRVAEAAPAPHPILEAQGTIPLVPPAPMQSLTPPLSDPLAVPAVSSSPLPSQHPANTPLAPRPGTYCIFSLDTGGTGGVRVAGGALSTSDCSPSTHGT